MEHTHLMNSTIAESQRAHDALIRSAAPFEVLSEPSDMAYDMAASVEDLLMKAKATPSLIEIARAIDPDLRALNKRYCAMETALNMACQTALINGASKEEMRVIGDKVAEGDKF